MSEIFRRAASEIPEPFRRFLTGDMYTGLHVEEYHDGDTLVIKAELPGINPETDVDITVTGDTLTIDARREEKEEHRSKYGYRTEFRYGSFTRSFPLPSGVNEEDVHANYSDGVLEVRVPTSGTTQPPRKVRVNRVPGNPAEETTAAPPSDAASTPPGFDTV